MYSQISTKRFYRYCLLRENYYFQNSSGIYPLNTLTQAAKDCGISLSTLRQTDLKHFEREGLIKLSGGFIVFVKLSGSYLKQWTLFKARREEIINSTKPILYFTDLVKKRLIYSQFYVQAQLEADKIDSKKIKKEFKALVKNCNTYLGEKQGIHISMALMAKHLGKSKTTIFKYLQKLDCEGLISIRKNLKFIASIRDFYCVLDKEVRDELRNRTVVKKGRVYERKLNEYKFN